MHLYTSGWCGELRRCLCRPFAMLQALCHAAGVRSVIRDVWDRQCLRGARSACKPSATLTECATLARLLPCATVKSISCALAAQSCSFPLVTPCARSSWVCHPWRGVEERGEVTELRRSRRTWHPVFPSAVFEAACLFPRCSPVPWLLRLPCGPACQMWPLALVLT